MISFIHTLLQLGGRYRTASGSDRPVVSCWLFQQAKGRSLPLAVL